MSATSPLSRAQRALVAGVAGRALSVVSGLARGGPVRDTADEGTPEEMRVAALVHFGAAMAVAGVATALALVFFVLPPALYVAIFAIVTAFLTAFGVRELRRLRLVAGRGWLFWAGIGWGLFVASGAYLTDITAFVPHLWLAWTLGVLLLGYVGAGAVQTAFGGVLAALWVGTAALVGESLLPGFVILAALFAFPLFARPSRLVGAAAAILALALAVAWVLRLLPQTPALALAAVTLVCTGGLLRMVAARSPVDRLTGSPQPGWPGHGIRWITTAVGVTALVVLPLPRILAALREQVLGSGAQGRTGLLLPLGIVLLALALPGRLRGQAWTAVVGWVGGAVALVAALTLPAPAPTIATALVIGGFFWYGWSLTWRRTRTGRAWDVPVGIGWLALAAVLAALGRPWYVGAAVLFGLGAYVIVLAVSLRRPSRPGSSVAYGAGPAVEPAPSEDPPGPLRSPAGQAVTP